MTAAREHGIEFEVADGIDLDSPPAKRTRRTAKSVAARFRRSRSWRR
jgi:hypothetical protein